ncbi:MAG: hypothetical protein ACRD2D_03920, partial [Terriglobales bacterium]
FGAPTHGATVADFSSPGNFLQLGAEPVRVDILTEVSGLSFTEAWQHRELGNFGPVAVPIIGREDFIRNKRASGRLTDLGDIEALLR